MNAIERLREVVTISSSYCLDESCKTCANRRDALAAVDDLYQAAKSAEAHLPEQPNKAKRLLAAAVRRVEGDDGPPVSPFHTEPVPS